MFSFIGRRIVAIDESCIESVVGMAGFFIAEPILLQSLQS